MISLYTVLLFFSTLHKFFCIIIFLTRLICYIHLIVCWYCITYATLCQRRVDSTANPGTNYSYNSI